MRKRVFKKVKVKPFRIVAGSVAMLLITSACANSQSQNQESQDQSKGSETSSVSTDAAETDEKPEDTVTQASTDNVPEVQLDPAVAALVPEAIKELGVLKDAGEPTFPPHSFVDENNEYTGMDVELAGALAAVMGLELQAEPVDFQSLIPGVKTGKYNMAMTGFWATAEREEQVDMVTYLLDGTTLMVEEGNPLDLSLENLDTLCGHTMGAESGSAHSITDFETFANHCASEGLEPFDGQTFPSQSATNLALDSKRIDSVLASQATNAWTNIQNDAKHEVLPYSYNANVLGIAIEKGTGLAEALKAGLDALSEQGVYKAILDKWDESGGAIGPHSDSDITEFEINAGAKYGQ